MPMNEIGDALIDHFLTARADWIRFCGIVMGSAASGRSQSKASSQCAREKAPATQHHRSPVRCPFSPDRGVVLLDRLAVLGHELLTGILIDILSERFRKVPPCLLENARRFGEPPATEHAEGGFSLV